MQAVKDIEKVVKSEAVRILEQKGQVTTADVQLQVAKSLDTVVERPLVAKMFRTLEKNGVGKVYLGRRGHLTRLVLAQPKIVETQKLSTSEVKALRELLGPMKELVAAFADTKAKS